MAKNQAWCVYYRPHWVEYLWRSEFPSVYRPWDYGCAYLHL